MASRLSAFSKREKWNSIGLGIFAIASLFAVNSAQAVLTDNITIGNAKALGLGHAVTADPPGIDSVHFNPAGLTRLEGRQQEIKVISGFFNIELEFGKDYTDSWERRLYGGNTPEDKANAIASSPDGFFYDESNGATSETEGAALMLPFVGLTEIPVILAPLGGASYSPPDSKITFATNVYSPLMVGFNRADDDPGRFMGEKLAFSLITYFSPSVAVQVTDTLSIGAAITFNYAGVGLDLAFREPNFGLRWLEELRKESCGLTEPNVSLGFSDFLPCIDDDESVLLYDTLGRLKFEVENNLTFGMNLGVLWEATPWLSLGAVYQAPVEMDMEGEFSWDQGDSLLNFFQQLEGSLSDQFGFPIDFAAIDPSLGALVNPRTEGKAKVNMTMPAHMSFGFSLQVTPSLKINMDYKFTEWSEWQEIPVEFDEPIGVIFLASLLQPDAAPDGGYQVNFPLGLEDTWNFGLGVEYQWNDQWAFRMGYEDRPSSIPKKARSPLLPIGDTTLYSFGANYKLSPDENLEFAIGTMSSEVHMPGDTSVLGNSENYALFIYNPYSGNDITAKLDVLLLEMSYRTTW
ncbi:MAG: outer membrane protein transport protein [Pseudomonadales bacterium]|nr:outer membrane protein transport protein [Pseudomonadales bacterium]